MPQEPPKPEPDDRKDVYIRLRGTAAANWRRMLKEHGDTEQYHGKRALEDYCLKKKQQG